MPAVAALVELVWLVLAVAAFVEVGWLVVAAFVELLG